MATLQRPKSKKTWGFIIGAVGVIGAGIGAAVWAVRKLAD